jgi:hypothetical protein
MCILSDLRVVNLFGGKLAVYRIDAEGVERGGPTYIKDDINAANSRSYRCTNCGRQSPGEANFAMAGHLGRCHELIDPFNYPETETDPP